MGYRPVYRGVAQQPEFYLPADQPAQPDYNEIILISAMIVVVGVAFIWLLREEVHEGPVVTVYPSRQSDIPQLENIIGTLKVMTTQE